MRGEVDIMLCSRLCIPVRGLCLPLTYGRLSGHTNQLLNPS